MRNILPRRLKSKIKININPSKFKVKILNLKRKNMGLEIMTQSKNEMEFIEEAIKTNTMFKKRKIETQMDYLQVT